MLSLIPGLYDTFGLAASLILPVKMLLQDLCKPDYDGTQQSWTRHWLSGKRGFKISQSANLSAGNTVSNQKILEYCVTSSCTISVKHRNKDTVRFRISATWTTLEAFTAACLCVNDMLHPLRLSLFPGQN